jgi:predicted PurR-regulated permease PerM
VEFLYLIVVGIVLYVVSNWILDRIERARGERFEQRSVIFLFLLLGLALVTFAVLRQFLGE